MREVKGTLAAIKDDSQVFPEPGKAGVKGKREKRTAKALGLVDGKFRPDSLAATAWVSGGFVSFTLFQL
jgi:hypothetical protein